MSKFFSSKYSLLTPYTPGEQPRDMKYIKLNTNESPFPPSKRTVEYAENAARSLQLYSDPECTELVKVASEIFGVGTDEILFTNGSDEILNFAFMAFCDEKKPIVFPDITYGFYPVYAKLNGIPYQEIPLNQELKIDINDYIGINKNIIIANPNAPTGELLSVEDIEKIVSSNPQNVVIIDEAYVQFGGKSCIPLIHKYNNLLVTRTFSKSHSLAGARLGFGIGCKELITDLNTIKYSTNPYNINKMTMAAGIGALLDSDYVDSNCLEIQRVREIAVQKLLGLGFTLTNSYANFLFAKHPKADGKEIYLRLKQKGVLIRHFDTERLSQYNRITVGSEEQMNIFIEKLSEVLKELL